MTEAAVEFDYDTEKAPYLGRERVRRLSAEYVARQRVDAGAPAPNFRLIPVREGRVTGWAWREAHSGLRTQTFSTRKAAFEALQAGLANLKAQGRG